MRPPPSSLPSFPPECPEWARPKEAVHPWASGSAVPPPHDVPYIPFAGHAPKQVGVHRPSTPPSGRLPAVDLSWLAPEDTPHHVPSRRHHLASSAIQTDNTPWENEDAAMRLHPVDRAPRDAFTQTPGIDAATQTADDVTLLLQLTIDDALAMYPHFQEYYYGQDMDDTRRAQLSLGWRHRAPWVRHVLEECLAQGAFAVEVEPPEWSVKHTPNMAPMASSRRGPPAPPPSAEGSVRRHISPKRPDPTGRSFTRVDHGNSVVIPTATDYDSVDSPSPPKAPSGFLSPPPGLRVFPGSPAPGSTSAWDLFQVYTSTGVGPTLTGPSLSPTNPMSDTADYTAPPKHLPSIVGRWRDDRGAVFVIQPPGAGEWVVLFVLGDSTSELLNVVEATWEEDGVPVVLNAMAEDTLLKAARAPHKLSKLRARDERGNWLTFIFDGENGRDHVHLRFEAVDRKRRTACILSRLE